MVRGWLIRKSTATRSASAYSPSAGAKGPRKALFSSAGWSRRCLRFPPRKIARAWRWQDAPAPLRRRAFGQSLADLPDTGVDILAERHDGGLIAIQAKCLHPERRLVLDDLKQFWLKTKGNGKLAANWVVTTGEWGRTVAAHAHDANGALINAQSEWGDIPAADLGRAKPLELDANQQAAWRACVERFRNEDRGRLVMACGTGKTLVSLRVAEKIAPEGGLVVYATPSIALTRQSRRSWLANAKRPMRTMVVCSDEDEGAGGSTAAFTGFVSEIEAPVSTDPATIAKRVDDLSRSLEGVKKGMVAVFATYQSLHRICAAQEEHGLRGVDFVVADEAHRTAGKYDRAAPGPFQVVHHRLRAEKRLYQTATPRIYSKRSHLKISRMVKSARESGANVTIQDMGDASVYGPLFHRLSFREALRAVSPRLCDYRVIVLAAPLTVDADAIETPGEVRESDDSVENTSRNTRVAALAQAMQYGADDMEDIRSCIAFCNRVAFAGKASRLLSDARLSKWAHKRALAQRKVGKGSKPVDVTSGSLSARDNAKRRGDELQRLRDANGTKHVTTNVSVLSEGIDVPALDAICFLDERKSEVEIVQAVGRVMRRPASGTKKHGYIVVPVVMSPQAPRGVAVDRRRRLERRRASAPCAQGPKAEVDDVMLGSLELLFDGSQRDEASSFEQAIAESAAANRDRHRRGVETADDPFADDSAMMEGLGRVAIALTNPPFSSLKNLAADMESDVRAALVGRMENLRENVGTRWPQSRDAMSADSISPPFSFIFSERIHQEHGVVGKVMPTTVCINSSAAGRAERRLLGSEFEIDSVVTLHDPRRFCWSVQGQQESLLLIRRNPKARRSSTVRFISVRERPTNADETIKLYNRLQTGKLGDLGRVCDWPRHLAQDGDWSPAVFYEPELAGAVYDIEQWIKTKKRAFMRLGDLYSVSTTKETVGKTKWEWCDKEHAEVSVAKDAKESAQTHLDGRIDGWARRAAAQRLNESERKTLRAKAGRLLVTYTQNVSSARLAAVAFRAPVVGYAWTPVRPVTAKDAKALAVWINSTVGRILMRKYASRSTHWPMYQPAAIKQLVIPNTAASIWQDMREPLLDAYRATRTNVVPQYREQDADVRRTWDEAVAKAAGVPLETIHRWRALLNAEPFVSGSRET